MKAYKKNLVIGFGLIVFLFFSNIAYSQNTYKYSPDGCLFEITFHSKPKFGEMIVPILSAYITAKVAEYYNEEDMSLQKVEYLLLNGLDYNLIDKDFMIESAMAYVNGVGLHNPTFTYEESEFGKVLELRAYKNIEFELGVRTSVTYVSRTHIKGDNMFIVYVGSRSVDYPTKSISNFLNSVRLK